MSREDFTREMKKLWTRDFVSYALYCHDRVGTGGAFVDAVACGEPA